LAAIMAAHHDRVFTSRNSEFDGAFARRRCEGAQALACSPTRRPVPAFHSKAGDYIGIIITVQPRSPIPAKKMQAPRGNFAVTARECGPDAAGPRKSGQVGDGVNLSPSALSM
jgi:hypothetical protein